jgi:hypothetical protein
MIAEHLQRMADAPTNVGDDVDAPFALTQQENVEHSGNNGKSREGEHDPPTDGSIVSGAAREPRGPALFESGCSFWNLSCAPREILGRNR